jgi:hypothetical protein
MTSKKRRGARNAHHHYKAQIAALQAERNELRAALRAAGNRQRTVGVSDYHGHVELAAKGLAQRDKVPMPPWVTTPEGFYELMAAAALDATGLRDLLERVARAEPSIARTTTTSGRRMVDQVTHLAPRAVESCGLASGVMGTKSSTGRWFSPGGDRWWRVWAWP